MANRLISWVIKPTSIKLMVNVSIIVLGGLSAIISIVPEGWMANDVKVFVMGVIGAVTGMMKGFEKLTIDGNNEFKKMNW